MAAILCESIGKIIRNSCEACGTVLTLPCRACGFATEQLTQICRSPFCFYLSVALGFNLPPVVFTGFAFGAGNDNEDCHSAVNWMYVNALLCLINMAAGVYISMKIAYEPEGDNAEPYVEATVFDNEKKPKRPEQTLMKKVLDNAMVNDTRAKSFARVKDILCYDPVVAVYIIIGIFYVVWQTMGVGRSRLAMDCGGDLYNHISNSLTCGFLFMTIGGMAFGISLCCLGR